MTDHRNASILVTLFGAVILLAFLAYAVSAAEPAPTTSITGALVKSGKGYVLSIPTTVKVGEQDVVTGSYDLPLTLPDGYDGTALPEWVGQPVSVSGYLYGSPKALLVVDATPSSASSSPPSASARKTAKDKKTDLFGDPVTEKKEEKK